MGKTILAKKFIKNKKFVVIVLGVFFATILAMSFRQLTGLHLGFITLIWAIVLVLIMEIFHQKLESPNFEEILGELDWRALLFYITLFILVGGINHVCLIKMLADTVTCYCQNNLFLSIFSQEMCFPLRGTQTIPVLTFFSI